MKPGRKMHFPAFLDSLLILLILSAFVPPRRVVQRPRALYTKWWPNFKEKSALPLRKHVGLSSF